jgi:hypothetical protein
MNFKRMIYSLIVCFLAVIAAWTQQDDYASVTGQAVDKDGRGVADAVISWGADPPGDIGYSFKADAAGFFRIRVPVTERGYLWITNSTLRPDANPLLEPGVNLLDRYLAHPAIRLSKLEASRETALGKVQIQTYFCAMRIHVNSRLYSRIFETDDAIQYRLSESNGRYVTDSKGGGGEDPMTSTIRVALPSGSWKLEIKTNRTKWIVVSSRLIIPFEEHSPIDLQLSEQR